MIGLTYFNIEADGRLGVYLTPAGKEEREELYKNLLYMALRCAEVPHTSMLYLASWIEQASYGSGYSDFCWVTPEQIGGLTSCDLILVEHATFDESMQQVISCGRVFWYPDYQVRDPLYDLLTTGVVYLTRGSEDTAA